MLLGILDRYEKRLLKLRATLLESLPKRPSSLLKATVMAVMSHPSRKNASLPTIIGLMDEQAIREKIADLKLRIFNSLSRELPHPEQVAVVLMILDGLLLAEMSRPPVFPKHCVIKIYEDLLSYVDTLDAG